jgi:hypothetical protein
MFWSLNFDKGVFMPEIEIKNVPHTTTVPYTPTPWTIDLPAYGVVLGANNHDVAYTETGGENNAEVDAANARFIVRACNSFDLLLKACEAANSDGMNGANNYRVSCKTMEMLHAAIRAAKADAGAKADAIGELP